MVRSLQYDGLDRLAPPTHAKAGNTLADFQYQFNAVNSITQMIDNAGTHNYTYDNRDRLTAATHPNQPNESYTLDDVGNRTASHQGSSYSYQAFNRMVSANGATFGYDTNGNLTSKTDATGTWSYSWDYENRLKQATKSGGVTVTYSFDAPGRRIQRTSSASGTTKFVYDGADVVRDLDGPGATTADYLNGPGIDNKLRQTAVGMTSYFIADHLGTTRALADVSGNITSNLAYDSFGNVISGSASTRYTYTGREIDSDTGLMYYRARWYDPQQGRFISEDPIGFEGGINFFAYVGNNPLLFRDPFGLCPQSNREERCLKAIEDGNRIKERIDKTIARSLAEPGGIDAGHVQKIEELRTGLEDALRRIDHNCNNHEKEKHAEEIEKLRDGLRKPVPQVGDRIPLQEMKITAAIGNVLGGIGVGVRAAWRWVFR